MPDSLDDRWDRYRMEVGSGREEKSADVDIVYTIDKPFDKRFELKDRMSMGKIEVLIDENFKPQYPLSSRGSHRFGNGIRAEIGR